MQVIAAHFRKNGKCVVINRVFGIMISGRGGFRQSALRHKKRLPNAVDPLLSSLSLSMYPDPVLLSDRFAIDGLLFAVHLFRDIRDRQKLLERVLRFAVRRHGNGVLLRFSVSEGQFYRHNAHSGQMSAR